MKLNFIAITLITIVSVNSVLGWKEGGSWSKGFSNPSFNCKENNGQAANQGKTTFFAEKLQSPSTNYERLGLVFTFDGQPGSIARKFLTSCGQDCYYLPFRFLAKEVTSENPFIGHKKLTFNIVNDSTENFTCVLSLPNKTIGWYINNTELKKIKTLLNEASVVHRNNVNNSKVNTIDASDNYIAQKSLLKVALNEGASLKNMIAEVDENLKKIKIETEARLQVLDVENSKLKSLSLISQQKASVVSRLQAQHEQIINDIHSRQDTLKNIGHNSNLNSSKTTDLKNLVETNLRGVKEHCAALTKLASNRATDISGVVSATISLNKDGVSQGLSKVHP